MFDWTLWKNRNETSESSTSTTTNQILPLSRLGEVEIGLGGIVLAEMRQDHVQGFTSLDSWTGAVRFLELEVRNCWMNLEIVEGTLTDEALECHDAS